MPIGMLGDGENGIVKRISGKDEAKKFLENLGFVPGADISVVTKTNGNVIINVKGARVAIGKEMANRVFV